MLQLCRAVFFCRKSVRLSVKRLNCDKTEETSAHIVIPCERSMRLVLRHEEWLVGDVPFYLKFWDKWTYPWKTSTSNRYLLVAPQTKQLSFPMSLIVSTEQRMLPLRPRKGIKQLKVAAFYRYAVIRPSVICLSSIRNVYAPYSGDWNFRHCVYAIWYLGQPLTTRQNFTEIVPGEPLRWRS